MKETYMIYLLNFNNKTKNALTVDKCIAYFFSFAIPVVCAIISFGFQGIYPGGPNTILVYDLKGQIVSFYSSLSHFGQGFNSLFHTMSGGLGGNFWGVFAYYISPLDFIYSFVGTDALPEAVYFLVLLRIGLCGLFASFYTYNNLACKNKFVITVIFSCCYALMSYNFVFSILPMWFDCVALLPLLALCVDGIVAGKKDCKFVLLYSLCIISNYYIAYIIALSLFLYFVFKCIEEKLSLKIFINRFSFFLLSSILSAGIGAFILVPSALDAFKGRVSEGSIPSANLLIKNGLIEIISGFCPMSYHTLASDESPYIYCGSIIAILSLIWLLDKSRSLKTKAAGFVLLILYFVSFAFGPADRVWHLFQDPVGFSCRYSFTFVFVLIAFSIRSINFVYSGIKESFIGTVRLLTVAASLYTIVELVFNGSYMISCVQLDYHYSVREEYDRYLSAMEYGLNSIGRDLSGEHYRLAKNFFYSANDGSLYGYDGLQLFSSSYNSKVVDFLKNLGLDSYNSLILETGLTPPAADLLDVRYYYSYWYDKSDCYEEVASNGPYFVYRNQNALPLGIVLNDIGYGDEAFSSYIPFENLNRIFEEVSLTDDKQVFKIQEYINADKTDDQNPQHDSEETLSIEFTPSISGRYFIYRAKEYVPATESVEEMMPSEVKYLSYYLDGVALGTYGYNHHRYICDLGCLSAGQTYLITLEDTYYAEGTLYLYFYDHEACTDICSSVIGFDVTKIGSDGITLEGNVEKVSDLLVSLPYDNGYKVYVNGEQTDFESYRDALMLIRLNPGNSIVQIKFTPNGFNTGLCISLLSLLILIVLMHYRYKLP